MKRVIAGIAALLMLSSTGYKAVLAADSPALERIESDPVSGITEYKLKPNNLQVLLAERHNTPIVTVMVVYHVGSRNEAVGYTGSTHFLEHMMFRGTASHDPKKGTGIDDVLKPIGGVNNATTSYDRTNYYELVPAQYLGTCLELEADRMRNALLRQDDRDAEMTVVRNELERNEDDASRLLDWNEYAQAYLAHPYHHPVIGWRSDVENVPLARLRKFYNDFYYPNNATLVVIGDFKTAEAQELITKYFAGLPQAPNPIPPVYTTEPPQEGERRFTVQRGNDLPKVTLGYKAPPATGKDTYALEVAASLLGDDRKQSSRLYKALIDPGLASDCYAYNSGLKDPSLFTVFATATPGTPSSKLESIMDDQLKKLATNPPTDEELDKAKKSIWKRMKLEASDPMGMASQLAEAIAVADWKWWVNLEKNIKAVTKEDVQRVARQYFIKKNETVGYYYPAEKKAPPEKQKAQKAPAHIQLAALRDDGALVANTDTNRAAQPGNTHVSLANAAEDKPAAATAGGGAAQTAAATVSIASQVQKKVLPNGLTVLVMPVKGSGVVAVAGKIKAGDYFHPKGNYSVPDLTAAMIDKGSAHWTKEALGQEMELMGSSLEFASGHFWMEFESQLVKEDLPHYLSILGDVIQNPKFPKEELAKEKKQREADIHEAMADTGNVATNAFFSTVYKPECVYYNLPFAKQLEETNATTIEQLVAFHKQYITPANMVLSIVGDVNPADAFAFAEKNFAAWKGAAGPSISLSDCTNPDMKARTIEKEMADKANIEVVMGDPAAISIKSKDFYAAQLANAAFGHDTLSSRLAEVRNKYGYTYGISSYFSENAFENSPWVINFTVNPQNLPKALPLVHKILDDYIKEGINDKELDEEAKRLAGEYIVERMRTPKQLADAISKYEIIGLGAKFMDEYPAKLRAVTKDEANAAIKKYFNPDKMLTCIAGTIHGAQTPAAEKKH